MEQPLLPAPLANQDTLNRILEFVGPRHTILSIGSINKTLRQLSQHDSLWKFFWLDRCCLTNYDDESCSGSGSHWKIDNLDELLCQSSDSHHSNNDGGGNNTRAVRRVHRAALTFRHAIHSLDLQSKFLVSHYDNYESTDNNNDDDDTLKSTSLYEGYIQTHTMMKTNLRCPARTKIQDNSSPLQLCQQSCTETWPGQLVRVGTDNDGIPRVRMTEVTCLNSAEVWCDHPSCKHARCGPNGLCLRKYRFCPSSSDYLSFVKCDWCSVSFCNEHIVDNNILSPSNNPRRRIPSSELHSIYDKLNKSNQGGWYKCDECELSSCLQCTSQVFSSTMMYYPPIQICNVMTAGKKCGRRVCSNCVWFVGKECTSSSSSQQEQESVIPGGKVISDYNVVSIKAGGDDVNNDEKRSSGSGGSSSSNSSISNRERIHQLIEKEMCCSKCLRHVEFRWRELSVVIDMFDGFVP
jgi:hypothetical protein